MIKQNLILKITLFLSSILIFISCEDEPPMNYISTNFVEAILYVGEPIRKIKVMESQPLDKSYVYEDSFIKNADIVISIADESLQLQYDFENNDGYYFPDTTLIVLPDTKYKLKVVLQDGTVMTGETHTPQSFDWINEPSEAIYYPKDTIKLESNDSLKIVWGSVPEVNVFLISVMNLDTLEYGKYLIPPTKEMNRRVFNAHLHNDKMYRETSSLALLFNTESPTVWMSFKWFGKHRINVYAPDNNYFQWFKQMFNLAYDPLLSSIKGGEGCFGSASLVSKEFFLFKNQP